MMIILLQVLSFRSLTQQPGYAQARTKWRYWDMTIRRKSLLQDNDAPVFEIQKEKEREREEKKSIRITGSTSSRATPCLDDTYLSKAAKS